MSFFGKIGKFLAHAGHDIVHGVESVEHTIVHDAEEMGRALAHAVKAGHRILGEVEHIAGAPLRFVVGGVAHLVGDLIGIHIRSLTTKEKNLLRPIFHNTLPLDNILISSLSGVSGRAFTIPGSMVITLSYFVPAVGPILALAGLIEHLQNKFLINVGKSAYGCLVTGTSYDKSFREKAGSELVHEATHVWQGHNGAFSWWYVFNSLYYNIRCGQHAYDVDESHLKPWKSYEVEQQATLIEHWYSRGSKNSDGNFVYVEDNIRRGNPFGGTPSLH